MHIRKNAYTYIYNSIQAYKCISSYTLNTHAYTQVHTDVYNNAYTLNFHKHAYAYHACMYKSSSSSSSLLSIFKIYAWTKRGGEMEIIGSEPTSIT